MPDSTSPSGRTKISASSFTVISRRDGPDRARQATAIPARSTCLATAQASPSRSRARRPAIAQAATRQRVCSHRSTSVHQRSDLLDAARVRRPAGLAGRRTAPPRLPALRTAPQRTNRLRHERSRHSRPRSSSSRRSRASRADKPVGLAFERGLSRFKDRQSAAQSRERQHHGDRAAVRRHHRELPLLAPQAVVNVD